MDRDKYIGKRLEGRYELQELIGIGGMANVYKAFDLIDQRNVAVKILRDEFSGNEEFLRRFKNESKAIAVLNHPNIVRVYDVSFTGRVHSIVMEYIDGITLKDYIERQSVLTWKEAVHFTVQILRALQHAHDKGIVHRDIKPQNIMLLQNGTIKVTDFGIARFARSEVRTITDRAIGSVHYISPEQAMGEATDEKSDIYSVGVMLFEMLTGRLPFEAENAVSVALHQIQTQAVRPTSINPSIPAGLEDITLRAMQKDSARRYPSAAAMIADIERFKADPSIQFQYKYMETESPAAKNKKLQRAITETRKEETMPKPRRTPYIPILTGVTLAFVLASIGFIAMMVYLNNPFVSVKDIEVPELVGVYYDEAVQAHTDVVLNPEEGYSDEHAKGVIYEQDPEYGGAKIKVNSTINVKVSKGPRQVTLADYANQKVDQVMQKLSEDGLEPRQQNEYSDTVENGYVIYTDPSKGTTLNAGEIVTVYTSMGPKEHFEEVPGTIIGMTLEEAQQYLQLTPFRLGSVTEEPSDKPEGVIISMNPTGLQPEGTEINVVVSKGGSQQVQVNVPLPSLGELITIRARDADQTDIVYAEARGLDTNATRSWSFSLPVEDGDSVRVSVFISTEDENGVVIRNGRRYMTFNISDDGTVEITDDRSDSGDFDF